MSEHSQPPQWMIDYFQDCRDLLGLNGEWRLWLAINDAPSGDSEADGTTELNVRYLKATVTIRRTLIDNPERARYVLMHEALHIALARINLACDRLMDMIPLDYHVHANEIYTDAEEQTIELLTRALQRTIKPKEAGQ